MSNSQGCYAEFSHPSLKDAINQNNSSTFKLSLLVAEFAQQMAAAHEQFAKEVQTVIGSFRRKNNEFKFERPVDTPCSIQKAWESLLHETEMDAQAHLDAASLLIKNVYKPLEEVAIHKQSQAQKLNNFRNKFEDMLQKVENQILTAEKDYMYAYNQYQDCQINKTNLYNAHNEYIFQLRASNRSIDQFQLAIPQVLEELEEIYIDTSNTVNVAIESHALLLLTKANEQHRRFEDLLQVCRQVNPQLDISYFVNALNPDCAKLEIKRHRFHPVEASSEDCTCLYQNQLIIDKSTESALLEKRALLQREAAELTSYIAQNQDISHSLVNICQRNLANHLYSKVYETQEDMCRKRNEIRMANIQLAAVRAQIDLLTPKQNGTVENTDQDKSAASIKGMWKKAFKSLKSSSSSDSKLSKKSSLKKKQQGSKEEEEEQEQESKEIDPVYSLLKCAADLPKGARIPCIVHSQCAGQHNPDSSSSTSKTSSPSSSDIVVQSLGSEFKNYYKMTRPAKKTSSLHFSSLLI